jgi:hypothetical protein
MKKISELKVLFWGMVFSASMVVVSFSAIVFSSCNKTKDENKSNWVCTCKYRKKTKDTTVKYMYPNQTKEAASKACDKQEVYLQSVHGPTGTSCSNGF